MGVVCLYLNLQNQKFASYYAAQHLSSIAHEPVRIQRIVLRSITFLIWTTICNAAMITISIIAGTKSSGSRRSVARYVIGHNVLMELLPLLSITQPASNQCTVSKPPVRLG